MHPKLIFIRHHDENPSRVKKRKLEKSVLKTKSSTMNAFHGVCCHCGTKDTPLWRKVNDTIVCNACGIYWKTHGKVRTSQTNQNCPDNMRELMLLVNTAEYVRLSHLARQCIFYGMLHQITGQP